MIKLRITLESKQDVIRELVLDSELNLEQLHQEIIKHFNVMAQREVVRPNHGEASSDDRVVFDWAHTQNQYHYDFGLCDYFYKKHLLESFFYHILLEY